MSQSLDPSVLASLVAQTARQETDVARFAANLRGRLKAMASAQDLRISSQYRGADLRLLVNETVSPIVPPGDGRITVSGPDFFLPTDTAASLALVVHELATNSVKYGAWSNDAGTVSCQWLVSAPGEDRVPLLIYWRESAVHPSVLLSGPGSARC